MRRLDDFSLEVYVLKAIVHGLVSVLQDDREALERARTAALAAVNNGSKEDRDLIETHVKGILSPRLYKTAEETNA